MPSGASSRGCMSPTVACLLLLLCVARAGFLDTVHQILTNEAVVEPDGSVTPGFVCDGVLLPPEQLNDDYCDCADGSDENATSACAHTGVQFRCRNRGYTPVLLPSSLVHDGVCDCCDGSDEAAGVCVNECESKGAGVRVEILDMLATVMAGLRRRQADQRKADLLLRKWSEKIEGVNEDVSKLNALMKLVKARLNIELVMEREERISRAKAGIETMEDGSFKVHAVEEARDYIRSSLHTEAVTLSGITEGDMRRLSLDGSIRVDVTEEVGDDGSVNMDALRSRVMQHLIDEKVKLDGGAPPQPRAATATVTEIREPGEPHSPSALLLTKLPTVPGEPYLKDFLRWSTNPDAPRVFDAPMDPRLIVPLPDSKRGQPMDPDAARNRGLILPILNGANPKAMLIHRTLQLVGVALLPVRIVYDTMRLVVWVTSTLLSLVPIDAVADIPVIVGGWRDGALEWLWAQYDAVNTASMGAMNEVDWFMQTNSVYWAWGVVWGVGPNMAAFIFPPADWLYNRPQVVELKNVVEQIEVALEKAGERKQEAVDKQDTHAKPLSKHQRLYLSLFEECVQARILGYNYEVCPFSQVKQDYTLLGKYISLSPEVEGGPEALTANRSLHALLHESTGNTPGAGLLGDLVMEFTGGSSCWNGPDRSAKVLFFCSNHTHIAYVSEPSTCAYELHVGSTVACTTAQGRFLRDLLSELGMSQEEISAALKKYTS